MGAAAALSPDALRTATYQPARARTERARLIHIVPVPQGYPVPARVGAYADLLALCGQGSSVGWVLDPAPGGVPVDLRPCGGCLSASVPRCAACGARCSWADDAWVCMRAACGSEWYPDHGPEYAVRGEAGPET